MRSSQRPSVWSLSCCSLLIASAAHAQRAQVYAQNPVRTPAREWLTLPMAPSGGSLQNARVVVKSCVDHGRVVLLETAAGKTAMRACGLESLAKKNTAAELSAPALDVPATTDATRDQPDPFAEISAFYHVTRALAFFERLGFSGLPERLWVVVSARVPAGLRAGELTRLGDTALPLEPLSGSFYLPKEPLAALFGTSGPVLVLGQGQARDFAYDGDIVAHEVAHAVLRSALPGGSVLRDDGTSLESAGLVEGLADYFAAALSSDPLIAEYASGEVPGGVGTRSLESRARCPESITGDPHGDGQLVSNVLWATRRRLALAHRSRLDEHVLGVALEPPSKGSGRLSSFFVALRERVQAELPAALPPLDQALLARGLSREAQYGCLAVRELSPGQSLSGAGGPFLAPSGDQPGILQLRLHPPPGARQLHLRMLGAARKTPALVDQGPAAPSPVANAPFAPRLLGRHTRPLRWAQDSGAYESDAQLGAAFSASGKHWEATLDLARDGDAALYLQIVNAGRDGWYDVLTVRYTVPPGPAAFDAGTPTRATVSNAVAARQTRGGLLGCTVSATSPLLGWLLLALALVGLSRRRRVTAPRSD